MQSVDVFLTFVQEAANQPIVTVDDAGHLGDELVALVVGDVTTVIHQAGDEVALPPLLYSAFFNLSGEELLCK